MFHLLIFKVHVIINHDTKDEICELYKENPLTKERKFYVSPYPFAAFIHPLIHMAIE